VSDAPAAGARTGAGSTGADPGFLAVEGKLSLP
jgi:hypothetical protein